jgi:adenosylmethionine-8-amino-7-oxononanoate aminotransferase
MRDICYKHSTLFILDEIISSIGQCGILHVWQEERVVPDLQTIGKGLGGGYQAITTVLISQKVVSTLLNGSG